MWYIGDVDDDIDDDIDVDIDYIDDIDHIYIYIV